MSARRLLGEIDRTLKKIQEGIDDFDGVWMKVNTATSANATQKEKFEADLKKEIKRLQRHRDSVKTWASNPEAKERKAALLEARRKIEEKMELFKVVEKQTKTKAYSKEGLAQAAKRDPLEEKKAATREWINDIIETLNRRAESLEAEVESAGGGVKKKKGKQQTQAELVLEKHRWHVRRLERVLRLVDNGELDCDDVNDIQESVEDAVALDDDEDMSLDADPYDSLLEGYGEDDDIPPMVAVDGAVADKEADDKKPKEPRKDDPARPSADSKRPVDPPKPAQQPPVPAAPKAPTTPAATSAAPSPPPPAPPAAATAPAARPAVPAAAIPAPVAAAAAVVGAAAGRGGRGGSMPAPAVPQPATAAGPAARGGRGPAPPPAPASVGAVGGGGSTPPASATPAPAPGGKQAPAPARPSASGAAPPAGRVGEDAVPRAEGPRPAGPTASGLTVVQMRMLDLSYADLPHLSDVELPRPHTFTQCRTPAHFPDTIPPPLATASAFERFDQDTLFAAFYLNRTPYQRYLAARQLMNSAWRFHREKATWYRRLREVRRVPQCVSSSPLFFSHSQLPAQQPEDATDEYERGMYESFDYAESWAKTELPFKFDYAHLENAVLEA